MSPCYDLVTSGRRRLATMTDSNWFFSSCSFVTMSTSKTIALAVSLLGGVASQAHGDDKFNAAMWIDRLLSDAELRPLDFMWSRGGRIIGPDAYGSGFGYEVETWLRNATAKESRTASVDALIADGTLGTHGEVASLVNRQLKGLDPGHRAVPHFALVLRSVGSRESVPVLIDLLRRADEDDDVEAPLRNWACRTACTAALWELTGRKHVFSAEQWQAWWKSVDDHFEVNWQRDDRAVMSDQVMGLVEELRKNEVAAREKLVVLGRSGTALLLEALSKSDLKQQRRLAWVIDELGATDKLPPRVRREYFAERMVSLKDDRTAPFHLPIHQAARFRALEHCSFADLCQIVVAVDARTGKPGIAPEMRTWVSANSHFFRKKLGTADPTWDFDYQGVTESKDVAGEVRKAVPVIIEGLQSDNRWHRYAAVQLADTVGFCSRETPRELIRSLHEHWLAEENEHLRGSFAGALVRYQTPFVKNAIRRGLWSDRLEIVGDCAGRVAACGMRPAAKFPEIYDRLVELSHEKNDRVRAASVSTLMHYGSKRLVPHLKRLIEDPVENVRVDCAYVMDDHADENLADLLFQLVDDKQQRVRTRAIDALGNPVYRKSIPRLVPYLSDKHVHGYAVHAIADAGGEDALPVLMAELAKGNDVGGMMYQHLRRLTGQRFDENREMWVEWWKRQASKN